MSKHAYLILAHKNLWQLRTLLSLLDDQRNDIYLHIDASASYGLQDVSDVCHNANLECIKRRKLSWGGASLIKVEYDLLEAAVITPHSYYHLLSGMDLPLKSQDTIHSFFEANDGKEFIDLWGVDKYDLLNLQHFTIFPEGYHFFLTNFINKTFKKASRGLGIHIHEDVDFDKGSQWFSITEGLAKYIISRKEWINSILGRSGLSDEIFIPTAMKGSEFAANVASEGNLRFLDWGRSGTNRHPGVFVASDYDMLMARPEFWARKFDERVDKQIIEQIAASLLPAAVGPEVI